MADDAPTTTNPQAAADAYEAALDALTKVHTQQLAIIGATPVDWAASNAAQTAAADAQTAAQAAQNLYQAAIMDAPGLSDLLAQLTAATTQMRATAAKLTKEAKTLNDLAAIACKVTEVIGQVAAYVK
jgi:methylphosphotriester-DNA--protein-cysteine methyltransferase